LAQRTKSRSFSATATSWSFERHVTTLNESVLGSIPALPGESLDLEQEIAAATEEVMSRKARRKGW
jgi:hypothetical protein